MCNLERPFRTSRNSLSVRIIYSYVQFGTSLLHIHEGLVGQRTL